MKDKLIIFLKKYPLFLYLLPVFFVLHGFRENYDFVPVKDALLLAGTYIGFAVLLLVAFRLFYKSWSKAAIISFFIMAFHFFFGSVHDGLRNSFPGSFLSKYIFILPLSVCLFVFTLIYLKRRKKPFYQFALYLNSLLVLLLLTDFVLLINKNPATGQNENELPAGLIACPDCDKPDVYLVIADEYAGNSELKEVFHFDDSSFLNQLAARKFHTIPNSSSNYNFTPYSIASTLDMRYLDADRKDDQPLLANAYETIGHNRFLQFLVHHGYKFYNFSLSDFKGHPSHATETFLPVKTKLITSQTFLSRVEKELRFHLAAKFKSKQEMKRMVYENRNNNEKLSQLLRQAAEEKITRPKFVLTHLMMPHYPYYYDRNGKELPFDSLTEGNQTNRHYYIEYLQYTNKKLLELVDHILNHANSPPIIILVGDHGFRHFNEPVDPRYYFTNLVSVHLPGGNYTAFTDSITNVNLLRTVLNESFGQRLPLLKDTTFIMNNP